MLKFLVFGIAAGIMIHQRGTSRLAHAVKWFFIVIAIQDLIFSILYGISGYELIDMRTKILDVSMNNLVRVTGVFAIYCTSVAGAIFVWVLAKRAPILIRYEQMDHDRAQDRKWAQD